MTFFCRFLRSGILSWLLLALLSGACSKNEDLDIPHHPLPDHPVAERGERLPAERNRHLLLLYSAGFNSLHHYLSDDIEDLRGGFIPGEGADDNVLLIYSRNTPAYARTSTTPTESYLIRLYSQHDGTVVSDTLITYPASTQACDPETLHMVMTQVRERFPSKSYGMVFSSHASGWLPGGYYSSPSKYDREWDDGIGQVWSTARLLSSLPAVKSIGQDELPDASVEMTCRQFAEALPYRLDYLLFDACLMGCVEVAYEFRGKADYIGFSQAEVLAEGFDYHNLASHLIGTDTPDPQAVCEDYFRYYDAQSGWNRSATISLVDTRGMAPLAELCRQLFEKYRSEILSVDPQEVQRYFRFNRHWFYDLEDILLKAGIQAEEQQALEDALDACMVYRAATPSFIRSGDGGFDIQIFSGLSMYLPANGSAYLNDFYRRELAWNAATGLVN